MGSLGILLVAIAVALIILLVIVAKIGELNAGKVADARQVLVSKFGDGDYHLALPGPKCLGIVWDRQELLIGDAADPSIVSFADMRDANVEVDGVSVTNSRTVTSTNRGSQLAGGLIGGALLGPIGLLAGGLSGSSTATGKAVETRKLKSMKLVVRVADRTTPLRTFVFFDHSYGEGFEATSPIIAPAIERASHYHALLRQIIEETPKRDSSTATSPVQAGVGIGRLVAAVGMLFSTLALPQRADAYELGKLLAGTPETRLTSQKPFDQIERCFVMADLAAPPVVFRAPDSSRSIIHGGRSQPIFAFELVRTGNAIEILVWQGKGYQDKIQPCL